MIPPPTGLTLVAPQLQGPAPHGLRALVPPLIGHAPAPFTPPSTGWGPRSSRACPGSALRRASVGAPLPIGHAPTGSLTSRPRLCCPLRSLAPTLEAPFELQAQYLCSCGSGGLRAPQAEGLLQGACLAPPQGLPPSVQLRSAAGEGNDPERNPIESGRVTPRKHLPPQSQRASPTQ